MKWRIADFIVIAVVLLLAFGIWLYPALSSAGEYATIEQDGQTQTVSLMQNSELSLPHATITVSNGNISITQADCPDQVCVKTGQISRSRQSIVCVPNHIVITIHGKSPVDAIAN